MLVLNKISGKVLEINVCIQLNTCFQVLEEKLQIFLLICSHQVGIHNVQSQVVVNKPVPAVQAKAGAAFEDTMLLLEMVREKKQQEMKQIKVRQSS